MTLSFWFRDYVYIPLGGSRRGLALTIRNLLIVFALTGLWHGAAWTFVAWGLFHGLFLILERLFLGQTLDRIPAVVRHGYVILVVMAGWVLFRADNFAHAVAYFQAMAGLTSGTSIEPVRSWLNAEVLAGLAAGAVFCVPVLPWVLDRIGQPRVAPEADVRDPARVHFVPTSVLVPGLVLSVALLAGTTLNPFLYFRF